MADTFCVLAWRQLHIQPDGLVKVCCNDRGDDGASIYRHTVGEIWESPRLRELRRALAAGERAPGCAACYDSEDRSGASLRRVVNRALAGEGPIAVERLLAATRAGRAAEPPQQLVLETGNACNLRCRMCNPRSSSAIAADPVHRAWAVAAPAPPPEAPRLPAPWYRQRDFVDGELLGDATALRQLQVVGGETFMSAGGLLALRALVASGAAAHVDLVVNTNGTWVDEEWLALLGAFHSSVIAVSLEGVGAWNDYIRYPSRFADILAVIPRLRAVPRTSVMVSSTFQAYNALAYAGLLAFCDDHGLPIYAHPLQAPDYLTVRVLPPAARAVAVDRLRDYFVRRRATTLQIAVDALIPTLEDDRRAYDTGLARTFIEFTRALDADRSQSFAALEPGVIDQFAAAGLPWSP